MSKFCHCNKSWIQVFFHVLTNPFNNVMKAHYKPYPIPGDWSTFMPPENVRKTGSATFPGGINVDHWPKTGWGIRFSEALTDSKPKIHTSCTPWKRQNFFLTFSGDIKNRAWSTEAWNWLRLLRGIHNFFWGIKKWCKKWLLIFYHIRKDANGLSSWHLRCVSVILSLANQNCFFLQSLQ